MLRIVIDRDACIGSGHCCSRSPRVFALDQTGYAVVLDAAADSEENIVEGALSCPTDAIAVFRDDEKLA